jgi:hypothetical protein
MPDLLSSRDAARYLGKSEFTIRWWRTRNMGPPYYRVNRSISYSRVDLDQYLAGCREIPQQYFAPPSQRRLKPPPRKNRRRPKR